MAWYWPFGKLRSPFRAGLRIDGKEGTPITVQTDDGFMPLGGLRRGGASEAVPAAYAAINLVSTQLAILDRRVVDADGVPRRSHPIDGLLRFPSRMVDPLQFWLLMMRVLTAHGNSYAWIRRDFVSKRPIELVPAIVNRAEWVDSRHAPYQRYTLQLLGAEGPSGLMFRRQIIASSNDVVAFHGPGYDGLKSPSPVRFAAASILETMGRVLERYRAQLEEGGTLDKAITIDGEAISSVEQLKDFSKILSAEYDEAKTKNRIPVLPPGADLKRIQVLSASDMQLLDLLRWGVEDIARIWDVSPVRLGHYREGARVATFEHQAADFSRYTISPKAQVCDSQLTRKLLSGDDVSSGLSIQSDMDTLARGSLTERISAAELAATRGGFWTIDEARELTGKQPLPNGEGNKILQPKGAPTQEPPPRDPQPDD